MPPINHLNPLPNPFWEFVADMQHHPMFAADQNPTDHPRQSQPAEGAAAAGPSNTTNDTKEKQPVEDPPEVDPATIREQARQGRERHCRGRRRCGSGSDDEGANRREWPGHRGWGRHGHRGGFGGPWEQPGFPFARPGGPPSWGAGPHPPPPPPGFGPGFRGRGGHHHRGGPSHHFGPHGHGRRGPSPPHPPPPGPPGFDLGQFLSDLGTRIGMDLSGAAAGLGLDRFMQPHGNQEIDFEPKVDIFDRAEDYVAHVSLPGAKKSDVGVDWDGERYALRVAGVVHRPDVNETMLSQLVVDGRKRETGVFEKTIRLGTRHDPAVIDPSGIRARMADGVLIVTLPKAEKQNEKREVPIAKSQTPSPVREVREKEMMVDNNNDNDHEMQDAGSNEKEVINLIDLTREEKDTSIDKGKEAEEERMRREPSTTVEPEAAPEAEQLPAYNPVERHEGSDWENFESDDEGEFVKINVD